jgi:GTPase Era involved in 16S rRNA processing
MIEMQPLRNELPHSVTVRTGMMSIEKNPHTIMQVSHNGRQAS